MTHDRAQPGIQVATELRGRVDPSTGGRGASVTLEDLEHRYADVPAVDGISLDIRSGEFFTLLGPSGSGKTTTLHLVAGFLMPLVGEIYLDGVRITHVPTYKRGIGVVFQSYALFPHLTVFENVAFPLRVRRVAQDEIRRRVGEVLELVQLPGHSGRKIGQLSGGQQQRVAMARAIVFGPRLLLMDEPLGALDAQLRKKMQVELRRLQTRLGVTVVYVTHDQEEALTMSDRIAVMRLGRIEQLGSPQEIYERPRNRFVAEFIGNANLFPVRVEQVVGNEAVLNAGPVRLAAPVRDAIVAGQTVSAAIRPERILIGHVSRSSNTAEGVIVESFFVGDYTVMTVEINDNLRLTVKEPTMGAHTRQRLDRVTISWLSDDVTVLLD